jgi:hypothetical protein
MRFPALSVAVGISFGASASAFAATGDTVSLACAMSDSFVEGKVIQANPGQGRTSESTPSYGVIVDLKGQRAKGYMLSFSDDAVPFVPARISADAVSWQIDGDHLFKLDRRTGILRTITMISTYSKDDGRAVNSYLCKPVTRVF